MDAQDGMETALTEVLTSGADDQTVATAFTIIRKLAANILHNAHEEKFRVIKKSNNAIKNKVLSVAGTEQLLRAAGYTDLDDDQLALIGDDHFDQLKHLVELLDQNIEEISNRHKTPEQLKAAEELKKRQEEIQAQYRAQQEQKKKLQAQIDADKKERLKAEKAQSSRANQLQFGSNSVTYKDIGVDLNNQPKG